MSFLLADYALFPIHNKGKSTSTIGNAHVLILSSAPLKFVKTRQLLFYYQNIVKQAKLPMASSWTVKIVSISLYPSFKMINCAFLLYGMHLINKSKQVQEKTAKQQHYLC